jgi:hypothetical protein
MTRTLSILLLSLIALPRLASAAGAERRSVALLEFRQDVGAYPDIGERVAKRLAALAALRVVGPTEARQKAGSEVDAFVARCAGNARCVGALGKRLGVNEVILVGLSSLGDVIVQISRVDSESRQVLSNVGATLAQGATLTDAQVDEWLHKLVPAEAFVRYGWLRIRSNQDGADVFLNTQPRGRTPLPGPIQVGAPSTQSVRVSKKGYVDFRAELQVPPEAIIQVNAELPLRPRPVVPLYRKWWFWTALVVGVAAVAGVTAGAVVITQRNSDTIPAVVHW